MYPDPPGGTGDTAVRVTALSADASTIGGHISFYGQNAPPGGMFVKRSRTAAVGQLDVVRAELTPRGTEQVSADGRVALLLNLTTNAADARVQVWTEGPGVVDLAEPARYGSLSGDGRVVVYLRDNVAGIWVQRLR